MQKTNTEISKDGETPFMGRILKAKKEHIISKKRISYSRIRNYLKDYITDITADPEKYSLHSFRPGGALASDSASVFRECWDYKIVIVS